MLQKIRGNFSNSLAYLWPTMSEPLKNLIYCLKYENVLEIREEIVWIN